MKVLLDESSQIAESAALVALGQGCTKLELLTVVVLLCFC